MSDPRPVESYPWWSRWVHQRHARTRYQHRDNLWAMHDHPVLDLLARSRPWTCECNNLGNLRELAAERRARAEKEQAQFFERLARTDQARQILEVLCTKHFRQACERDLIQAVFAAREISQTVQWYARAVEAGDPVAKIVTDALVGEAQEEVET